MRTSKPLVIWGAVLATALFATPAFADRALSLDDALALARTHNRDLRAARARLDESATSIEQARVALLPTISAQGKYTHNYKDVTLNLAEFTTATTDLANTIVASSGNPMENAAISAFQRQLSAATAAQAPIVIQPSEQLNAVLNASVPLIAPSSYYALHAAKLSQRASESNFAVTEATVLLSVAQAFYTAAGTDELLLARQHGVTVAQETYEHAKARVAADLANQVDVTRAETALVRAQQDQLEADNARAAAYRGLATLLGTHDAFVVQTSPSQGDAQPGLADQVAGAIKQRPELAADRATVDAADANVTAGALRWSPTLSAFGNVQAFNYTGFSGDRYSWAVGLQLDWVLYDGGARDAQRHLASAQSREAQSKFELEADTIADEVANARGTLATKRHAVEAATHAVELARETLRLVTAQYEAGTTQQLDLLQAQDSVVGAEVSAAQAHFDLALADLQLRRAAGTFPSSSATR